MNEPATPQTERVIELAGSQVHAWVSGPADGPMIALSHGATMDHRMFAPQVDALVAAGYRVLSWDMRGHGRSKPIGRTPMSVADLAGELLAVLEQVGAQWPVCLVGQSMGGYVTQELIYREPAKIAAGVIIGATSTTLPLARWEQWALRSSLWGLRLWPYGSLRRSIARATARQPEVRDYAASAVGHLTKPEFIEVWRAVVDAIRPEPGYRIEQPLLLTHGQHDRTGNVARTAPRWAARDPHCRYEVIPDASHNANQDNPTYFNEILLDFLSEHYPAAERAGGMSG